MHRFSDIKIRPTILIVFFLLIGLTASISLGIQYYFFKNLAHTSTVQLVNQTSEKMQEKIQRFDEISNDILCLLELSENIDTYPSEKEQSIIINKFTTVLMAKKFIYALYIGYSNNNFYEIINLNLDKKLREKYKASEKERWLVVKIFEKDGKKIKEEDFLDSKLQFIRRNTKIAKYNPTIRPWYIKANNNKNDVIKTVPYLFSNFDSYGITYAKRLKNNKSVIGLDISLQNFSDSLKKQEKIKGSQFYLFGDDREIIASNIPSKYQSKDLKEILKLSLNKKNDILEIDNIEYLVSNISINSSSGYKGYLSIFIPETEIMRSSNEQILFAIALNMFVMMVVLPLIWIATKFITQPIHDLEIENQKIKNRKFDEVKPVNTRIKELHHLSKSLVSMSSSIKEYEQSQIKLMDSIVEVIAGAIDAKSEYTGGHCNRVPILTIMMADKASESKNKAFKDFTIRNEDELREINIAALLHDCGKVTTPEYVIDKATKLETIYNRIHEIRTRFEVVYRDLIIQSYEKLNKNEDKEKVQVWLELEHKKLISDFEFIAKSNIGGEFMDKDSKNKILEISQREWTRYFDDTLGLSNEETARIKPKESNIEKILDNKDEHIIERTNFSQEEYENQGFKLAVPEYLYNRGEVYNLCVEKGTLTKEERYKIKEHMVLTIKMLEQLPFPKYLKKVPEYASAHHETLIGTGYPRQLIKENMSVPARIMAVADIFEALTASDRPYKDGKKLSESIKILSFMVKDKHLDKDIFELLLTSGVYLDYAKKHLKPEQIDEIDIQSYLS